ncbi:MAG: right-handed parallel beta-helix repeat-containing protein [Capsulimonadales bacterium]|nr:right-handed parallel beta-helix repeat-containing protein [Capsulimonadales bacterium]
MKRPLSDAIRSLAISVLLFGTAAFAQTDLLVTNTEDEGPGSLREAILQANVTPGADTIRFAIPGQPLVGAHIIAPLSPLPTITERVTIDGTTQPGYSASDGFPRIQIIGTETLTSEFNGLTLSAPNSLVRGLALNRCGNAGIRLTASARGSIIERCFIGTDYTGENARANAVGIRIEETQEAIVRHCLISGNDTGVLLSGEVTGTVLRDCLIGTDLFGYYPVGNTLGIVFQDTHGGRVENCTVAANELGGIFLGPNLTRRAFISDCRFGIGNFDAFLPNGGDAIALGNAQQCVVERNRITSSFGAGISVGGPSASANDFADNFIAGNVNGIVLYDRATNNLVHTFGGGNDYARIQSNYGHGIVLTANAGSGNRAESLIVENNLGNGIAAFASGFTVSGCFLNDNGLNGVLVSREEPSKPYAERVRITGTTFKNNGNFGIRLEGNKSAGQGGNRLQPVPRLSQALGGDGSPTIAVGSLSAAPNKPFALEFFAVEEPDPSGFGEGEVLLGSGTVTTDAAGNASFLIGGLTAVPKGMWVTATATDPDGNTSEFSLAVVTERNPAPILESISPDTRIAGSPAFTLVVRGKDFQSVSKIQWDGQQRTTVYINSTELRTDISADDIATPRTLAVSVYTPAPGGGVSAPLTFTVANPVPILTTITPNTVLAGSGAVTVTVTGSNFVASSVVRLNGTDRPTTFVSATELKVVLPGSDTALAGLNTITVVTPGPGGGESGGRTFTVENPVPTVTGIDPAFVFAGSSALTVTIDGTGYTAGSVVLWNGSPRTTFFVTGTRVRVNLTREDLAVVGAHTLTVKTPGPGGGDSNPGRFTVIGVPLLALASATAERIGGETRVTFTLRNVGTATATGLSVKSSKLGTAAILDPLTQSYGNLAAGATSVPITLRFTGDVPAGANIFQVTVKASGKLFSASRRVTVP